MWVFRQRKESEIGTLVLTLAVGAAGGLAAGVLLGARTRELPVGGGGNGLRERAWSAAARLRPERRYRLDGEQTELEALEDAVLDAFLADEILSERGIDVGAISRGIIELSGSVHTEEDADRAVNVAGRVDGVETVVDRMEVEEEVRHLEETRQRFEDEDPALTETQWEGRRVGMGRMRQGGQTEPDRPDDSQKLEERALAEADRNEWVEEGFASKNPRMTAHERDPGNPTRFHHDDLDNQDPHRRHHAPVTLDEQPEERNSGARVGEPPKPGTELRLEDADVPVKPHGRNDRRGGDEEEG
ncbi:hypothetical protein BH23GEM7_BH23GEM7_40450 [soil metagenome]